MSIKFSQQQLHTKVMPDIGLCAAGNKTMLTLTEGLHVLVGELV
jgi:hypothetical protein